MGRGGYSTRQRDSHLGKSAHGRNCKSGPGGGTSIKVVIMAVEAWGRDILDAILAGRRHKPACKGGLANAESARSPELILKGDHDWPGKRTDLARPDAGWGRRKTIAAPRRQ